MVHLEKKVFTPYYVRKSMEVAKAMAETGNPNSVSDAGVGALAARSAVMGAYLNVKINSGDLEDKVYVKDFFLDKQLDISQMAYKLNNGMNKKEVQMTSKYIKKVGFFEKFFQLFS